MTIHVLTLNEKSALKHCEETISRTKESFIECGKALSVIQQERLYRSDFKSFEAYCQEKWGWSRQRAHQLIEASGVVQKLPKKVSTMVDSERGARALKKVPEAMRQEVLEDAVVPGFKTATAKAIEEVYESKKPKPPKPGRETWGPRDRKECAAAFGKFIRLADKAPFWNEIKASVEVIAKELRK